MTGLSESRSNVPHYHGHRERLKERFRETPSSLRDYELLELILFQAVPRRDTKPIAKALLDRFGTLSEVFGAPEALLTEVDGVGESVALHLKVYQEAARRFPGGAKLLAGRPNQFDDDSPNTCSVQHFPLAKSVKNDYFSRSSGVRIWVCRR